MGRWAGRLFFLGVPRALIASWGGEMSTEQQRQRLSCLMDGEANRFEAAAALDELLRSPDLTERWERWHLIGRGLRGERSSSAARAVSGRVRAATSGALDGKPTSARQSGRRWWYRPIAGAIAAGIIATGLAVLLGAPLREQPSGPPVTPVMADSGRWQQPDPAVRAQLDRLLVNHQEQVGGTGRTGVAAYAAVIGFEPGL
jgi:hypothetical protein